MCYFGVILFAERHDFLYGEERVAEIRQRKEDQPLDKPNRDGNVWPKQTCPAFTPRGDAMVGICECWYCCFADFHLDRPRALDVGVCYYPDIAKK